jgi:hypothetical protein
LTLARLTEQREVMEITEALLVAGLKPRQWKWAMDSGYPGPPTSQGKDTVFSSHDLVGAIVLGQLLAREIRPQVAQQIAADVLRLLARDTGITELSAWKVWRGDQPQVVVSGRRPNKAAIELLRFDITAIRLEVNLAMREAMRRKGKN